MTHEHIAAVFDRDLERIQALVMKMGGLAEAALNDAATALEARDGELAERVRAGDAALDALEEEINAECAKVIALRAPTAGDLRTVLTVMKIASALERCGDYAKNLARRSLVLAEMPRVEGAAGSIRRMARQVGLLLRDALDAYARRDAELAREVRARDEEVDQMYGALFREFVTHMMADPRLISPCLHLHFIAKNIERVGDHATSIAEQVIYLVSGALPGEERPKDEGATLGQPGRGL
ncbi:MAG: phosphate signaling complex protein PhoU [Phaeovulum sp.]|uniref:phosphate signaling complex protein PhoU n=1 Tax=Phaeovulum sp. TaxID=2934796 RepID=UPI0027313BFA|nr:phosphate signaling complex protein PhoU [Phaeovulum sp.]MDP2062843.1 phosphate signaling complex protein PhoU [Phaeovulum sp.]